MEKYLEFDIPSLDNMLAACRDFKERQNIRGALRELKGIPLDGNPIVVRSFKGKSRELGNQNPPTVQEPVKIITPQKRSQLRVGVLDAVEDRDYRLNKYFETKSTAYVCDTYRLTDIDIQGLVKYEINGSADNTGDNKLDTDENANVTNESIEGKKASFRSYLYAGRLSSPKESPRPRKDETFRAQKVNITRVKVIDKSDLQDKSIGTDQNFSNLSKSDNENDEKVIERELRDAVNVITPTKWKLKNESKKVYATNSKESLNDIAVSVSNESCCIQKESKSLSVVCELDSQERCAINCDKPVFHSSLSTRQSQVFDKGKCTERKANTQNQNKTEKISKIINDKTSNTSSPRREHLSKSESLSLRSSTLKKPRKIVSYRTSAFTSPSKLNPISSTVSRARLHSAPPIVHKEETSGNTELQQLETYCDEMRENQSFIATVVIIKDETMEESEINNNKLDKDFDDVFKTTVENGNNNPRRKIGLSRKNRVDSDEHKHYKKFRRKRKENEEKETENYPKLVTVINAKNSIYEQSAKKVSKPGTPRRKLPEIPIKNVSDCEDDETIHQRTIQLLQERRRERVEKLHIEKVNIDTGKTEKSRMTPEDLKKTLEQKLKRSDSKKKAIRARRELQLLKIENKSKSENLHRSISECERSSLSDAVDGPDNNEIVAILKQSEKEHKTQSRAGPKTIHRSKLENVQHPRAFSETDAMFVSVTHDTAECRPDTKVAELLAAPDPQTPLERINLIGSLMQEEERLQNLLRKSSNFSEKRQMRADVRQLRERRTALEGGFGSESRRQLPRRSVSVTESHGDPSNRENGPDCLAVPVQEKQTIEHLRRQLSETQDYDEKKKIRLALRQLRQHNRDGAVGTNGLQRSQSFVLPKSSETVDIGDTQPSSLNVTRSQSVTDKHKPSKENKQTSGEDKLHASSVTNGYLLETHSEKTKHSQHSSSEDLKPPIPKSVHKKSISISNFDADKGQSELKHKQSETPKRIAARKSVEDNLNSIETSELKNNRKSSYYEKEQTVKTELNSADLKDNNSGVILNGSNKGRSFELFKDTVTKLEDQKKNRVKDRCEIFENASYVEKQSNAIDHIERSRGRTPNVLVSRTDIEKTKQDKLVSVRRIRSLSEEPRGPKDRQCDQKRDVVKETHERSLKKFFKANLENETHVKLNNYTKPVRTETTEDLSEKEKHFKNKSSKDIDKVVAAHIEKKVEANVLSSSSHEIDKILSPSLQWLEEKRKSLTTQSDVDKLMSTMDLEQAFSKILEDIPDDKSVKECPMTADIPILEEEGSETNSMEEDMNRNRKNIPSFECGQSDNSAEVENITTGLDHSRGEKHSSVTGANGVILKEDSEPNASGELEQTPIRNRDAQKQTEHHVTANSQLTMAMQVNSHSDGAVSVIHGEDGTITVQEVTKFEEGDTTVTEYTRVRRTKSKTETREKDKVVERKVTSPSGSSLVYEKDISKSRKKLTARGSEYFNRNTINIKKTRDLEGTEIYEHELSSFSENVSVSKNESWGEKMEAQLTLNRELSSVVPQLCLPEEVIKHTKDAIVDDPQVARSSHVQSHLGRPYGCPEIASSLKEVTVMEGSAVTLECCVVASPAPTVSWYKGDNLVTDKDGVDLQFNSSNGKATLVLKYATVANSGLYKCLFQNTLGSASSQCHLHIQKKVMDMPSFITTLSDASVREGQSLCLECDVANTDTVTWFKDGKVLRNDADFKQTFVEGKAKLEIIEVFIDDFGTYSCLLKNANGEHKSSCQVTVKECKSQDDVFPVFLKKPETQIADERETVIFECEVIGSPKPEISWFSNKVKVTEGTRHRMSYDGRVAMLVIRKVTLEEKGKIECLAENTSGRIAAECMLVVQAIPSIPCVTMPLTDLETIEGSDVTLECGVQGEPTPEITWRKNGLLIGPMLDFKQTYQDGMAQLVISKSCVKDCGQYECVAANQKGEATTFCQLTVSAKVAPKEDTLSKLAKLTPKPTEPMCEPPHKDIGAEKKQTDAATSKVRLSEYNTVRTEQSKSELSNSKLHDETVQRVTSRNTNKSVNNDDIRKNYEAKPVTSADILQQQSAEKVLMNKSKTSESSELDKNKVPVTVSVQQTVGYKAKVSEDTIQQAQVEQFSGKFVPKVSEETQQKARSQSSRVMLVRQGSLRILGKSKNSDASLRRSGSLQSINMPKQSPEEIMNKKTTQKDNEPEKKMTIDAYTAKDNTNIAEKACSKTSEQEVTTAKDNTYIAEKAGRKTSEQEVTTAKDNTYIAGKAGSKTSEQEVTTAKDNTNIAEKAGRKTSEQVNADEIANTILKQDQNFAKSKEKSSSETAQTGTDFKAGESLELGKPKAVLKFKSNEIRRTQSVKTPGSEKPEWLQLKLRKVGINQTTFIPPVPPVTSKAELQEASAAEDNTQPSSCNVPINTPLRSVHNDIKLEQSNSAGIANIDHKSPNALKDTTNSPVLNPKKDSTQSPVFNPKKDSGKLTPVSERAKLFLSEKTTNMSGRQSPSDIIAKAITLSRHESMRTPVSSLKMGIQRSGSFRTSMQSSDKTGDVTLDLSPQHSQGEGDSSGSEKAPQHQKAAPIKYWDPTAPSQAAMDYNRITDEEELNKLLSNSDNFDERKKIRARIKDVREQHQKEWEAKRESRQKEAQDLIKEKHRQADLDKQRKLDAFQKQAATHHEAKHLDMAEQHLREKHRLADEEKKKRMEEYQSREAVHKDSKHLEVSEKVFQERIKQADILKQKTLEGYDRAAGKDISQTSTSKTETSSDGRTTTTTRRLETVTKVGGANKPAEEIAPQLAQQIINATSGSVSGVLKVKTELWSSKDGVTHTSEKTESWGGKGAMNAFKQMDAKNNPTNPLIAYTLAKKAATTMRRNAVTIKQDILRFCQMNTAEYETIAIENFSSSWNNGLAFCALIHHFYPESFDFKSLDPKQRRKNFELAFDTAEKYADIAPLLDVEDMIRMEKPDWKCVFTYVQSFYRKLHDHEMNKAK
ncbi:muscle M-line assembly protein unc-89-like isoform X4 [Dreissena polymorpha]|uniref:muscle M-line assembly protein unc-89-like isoform X4 n=1 Tax=Dreissena polymorpha TaxID=45954 RepID=UPI0022650A3B|nr:muscle M-line assembly protein unc-89-like isoform X4 [Dreissena polymorpha]